MQDPSAASSQSGAQLSEPRDRIAPFSWMNGNETISLRQILIPVAPFDKKVDGGQKENWTPALEGSFTGPIPIPIRVQENASDDEGPVPSTSIQGDSPSIGLTCEISPSALFSGSISVFFVIEFRLFRKDLLFCIQRK
jgi:hypothetical protein